MPLPRQAYVSEDWFKHEREALFGKCWTFAGVNADVPNAGDFRVVQAGPYSIILIRDADGKLRAYHNQCRHRGTELLEGCGHAGKTIVCPYHNWTYGLDGRLRGIPAQKECFPDIDKASLPLKPASVGEFAELVFVHPEPEPPQPFNEWLAGVEDVPWPHQLSGADLFEGSEELVYEVQCNWKVFVENALDGYHLALLHRNTLGGPTPDKNIWERFGDHMVWWSTEREGVKHRIPQFVEEAAKDSGLTVAKGGDVPGYGGVYLLFPTTLLTPNPWGFSITAVEPVNAQTCLLRIRNWAPKGWFSYTYRPKDVPGYDKVSGRVKSSHWTKPPLETGDFQTEDVWVCEKMQRALNAPNYEMSYFAKGMGGEEALVQFQNSVQRLMTKN